MTAAQIALHAMELINRHGHIDSRPANDARAPRVAKVGPEKDFCVEHRYGQTREDKSIIIVYLNKSVVFEAVLGPDFRNDMAQITEKDRSITQRKSWSARFLEIK